MKEEFPGQKSQEKLIKVIRKHPLTLSKQIFKFAILFVPAIMIIFFVGRSDSTLVNYINMFALALIIFALSYGFYSWVTWYYDVYILTSERIIEVEQKGLFNREVKEISLEKIQDVTYNVTGFMSTIFEVGTVKIHSASGLTIDMDDLSSPGLVRELVVKLVEKKERKRKNPDIEELATVLAKRIKK